MKVLVACIGNIFLGDDAFGVEVAKRLAYCSFPAGVTVRDFGIRSYDLAYALMDKWDLAIIVDALPRGGEPGTVYILEPELPNSGEGPESLDAHSMNPVAVLQLARALGGGKPGRILVVGCEPATVEADGQGNIGLSAAVNAAVEEAIVVIQGLIAREQSSAAAA